MVSMRVVKLDGLDAGHIGYRNLTLAPMDLPIQLRCMVITRSGQAPSSSSNLQGVDRVVSGLPKPPARFRGTRRGIFMPPAVSRR